MNTKPATQGKDEKQTKKDFIAIACRDSTLKQADREATDCSSIFLLLVEVQYLVAGLKLSASVLQRAKVVLAVSLLRNKNKSDVHSSKTASLSRPFTSYLFNF